MSRAISFTQAQVRRAIRAAEKAGLTVYGFRVLPDGTIAVDTQAPNRIDPQLIGIAPDEEIVL